MAYATDLKSVVLRHAGSNPVTCIFAKFCEDAYGPYN